MFSLFTKVKISIERTRELIEKDFSGPAKELLALLNINLEEVLIIKNGSLVTEDEELSNDDDIKLLSVVSGG